MNEPQKVIMDQFLRQEFAGCEGRTLEERVQELVDREEIRELSARYAQRVSHRQSMADMFTHDGSFIVRMPGQPPQVTQGRAQLDQAFTAAICGPALNVPSVHNQVISIAGDEAIGTSWVELYTLTDNERTYAGCGYYTDRLRREHGRWKFAVRDATVLSVGPEKKG